MRLPEDIRKKIINLDDLEKIREDYKDKKIVFSGGCWDLFHLGHALFISQCKKHGDIHVVGVGRDSTLKKLKGNKRPIFPELNRLAMVACLKDVDYTLLTEELIDNSDIKNILKKLKPDIFTVCEEDIMAINAEKGLCKELGIEMRLVPRIRVNPSSTREIIQKIKENG